MTEQRLAAALAAERRVRRSYGFWESSLRRLVRNKIALASLIGLAGIVALAFAAPLIEQGRGLSRDEIALYSNYLPPSAEHWFGTDEFGRDYFIRVLYGGQVSIIMGFGVALVVIAIGVPVGLAAGYFGGVLDDSFNWIVQIMATVPLINVLLFISALIPPVPATLAVIIGAFGWPGNARQARGVTLQLRQAEYVQAARTIGATNGRIMFRHLLPNIISLMVVLAGFDVVAGVLAETTLSYLGLGIRPPMPSWGNMLTNSMGYAFRAPYLIVFPVLAISLFVLCVYMLADGLRDAFDPNLQD